jgi:predicted dinucleotide-binding enzyme
MRVGIIGAGLIGGTLTRRLSELGHDVYVSNSRAPETLADLANETGATPVWAKDAAADADLVIVSIPQKNVPDLADGIVDARRPGAPVIETNNYYPQQRDGEIAGIEDGQTESAWVAEQIGAPVYKVFNGIWWAPAREGRARRHPEADRAADRGCGRRRPRRGPRHRRPTRLRTRRRGPDLRVVAPAAGNAGVRQGLRRRGHGEGARRGDAGAYRRVERTRGLTGQSSR